MSGAMSKSEGKPRLGEIFKWLDDSFLLAMSEAMRVPVEVLNKYPKDNWRRGKGDSEFAAARKESALRHLQKSLLGEKLDEETGIPHIVLLAVNAMMIYNAESGGVVEGNAPPLGYVVDSVNGEARYIGPFKWVGVNEFSV